MPPIHFFAAAAVIPLYVALLGAALAIYYAADQAWKADTAIKDGAKQSELVRRSTVVAQLRNYYMLSHDGLSTELVAGMAWPPDEWMNQQLGQLGETWTVHATGGKIEVTPAP